MKYLEAPNVYWVMSLLEVTSLSKCTLVNLPVNEKFEGKTYPACKLIAEPTLTISPVRLLSLFLANSSSAFLSAYSPINEKPLYLK